MSKYSLEIATHENRGVQTFSKGRILSTFMIMLRMPDIFLVVGHAHCRDQSHNIDLNIPTVLTQIIDLVHNEDLSLDADHEKGVIPFYTCSNLHRIHSHHQKFAQHLAVPIITLKVFIYVPNLKLNLPKCTLMNT